MAVYILLGREEYDEPRPPLPPPPPRCAACEVVQGKRICQSGHLPSVAPAGPRIDSETGMLTAAAAAFDLGYEGADGIGGGGREERGG